MLQELRQKALKDNLLVEYYSEVRVKLQWTKASAFMIFLAMLDSVSIRAQSKWIVLISPRVTRNSGVVNGYS